MARKKKDIHILYLIKKEKGKLLKIGLTKKSNLNSRVYNIEKDFGKIDYNNSYICYSKNEKDIDNLEKLLHKTFYKSRRRDFFKNGVGKTEWFKDDILDEVMKQINFLRKKNTNYKNLSTLKKMNGETKRDFKKFSIVLDSISLVLYIGVLVSLGYLVYYIQ